MANRVISLGGVTISFPATTHMKRDELIELYWTFHPRYRFLKTLKPDARLLDVGAGSGGLAVWKEWKLPRRSDLQMYGVDREVAQFAKHYKEFHIADLEAPPLPFADATFDAALLSHVFEHVRQGSRLLSEIRRVLRPGARFYLEIPTPRTLELPRREEFVRSGLNVSTVNFFDDDTHVRTYELKELSAMLDDVGCPQVESGLIENPFLEDALCAAGAMSGDQELATYGLWLKLGWAQYVVARKR